MVRAAILGIVQGLSEFLPISSSGHLILGAGVFRWPDQGTSFDVGLHVGTLLALLVYFWRDWVRMIHSGLVDLKDHQLHMASYQFDSRLLWLLALGSIPAAVVGVPLDTWFEENVRQAWVVAITLAVVATVMLVAERYGQRVRRLENIGVRDAVIVGLAQACALVPCVLAAVRRLAPRSSWISSGRTPPDSPSCWARRRSLARPSSRRRTSPMGRSVTSSSDSRSPQSWASSPFMCCCVTWRSHSLMPFILYRYGLAVVTLLIAGARVA